MYFNQSNPHQSRNIMIKGTILIADDEKRIRDVFVELFEEYRVLTAADGTEALRIIEKPNSVDIVVLDVMMPGINGIELLKKIKKIDPDKKVVIFTGCDSKEIVVEALRGQADEYIDKPFDIDELRLIFERLLAQSAASEDEFIDMEGKIRKACEFIERNYNRMIKLEDLAREIYLSPKYVSRIFKKHTGFTFNEYKINLRMEKAKELLSYTRRPINQIAAMVGYQNAEGFIKIFKRKTKLVPSQYRERSGNQQGKDNL